MCFTEEDSYQNFIVFVPVFSFLILDSNRKVTDWMSTGILLEKIRKFDTGLECLI